jgi:outer membrane lipoprotein SlyB
MTKKTEREEFLAAVAETMVGALTGAVSGAITGAVIVGGVLSIAATVMKKEAIESGIIGPQ